MRARVFMLVIGILLTAAVAGVSLRAQTHPPAPPYRFATLDRGPVVSTVRAAGTLSPEIQVLVSAASPGTIKELLVADNSVIRTGDVLAKLDPTAAETHLALVRADLDVAQRTVDISAEQRDRARILVTNATAALAGARADALHADEVKAGANQDLRRILALAKTGDSPRIELERVKAAAEQAGSATAAAEARLSQAEAALAAAQSDVRVAEAQLRNVEAGVASHEAAVRDAELQLDQTSIRSPIDGIVLDHTAVVGQVVSTQPGLFTVASDLGRLGLNTNVDEADIGRIEVGQEARFTVDAFPGETFTGTVTSIKHAPQVAQNVVTYDVVVTAANPERKLLPGMTATTTITTGREADAVRVPLAALRFRPQGGAALEGDAVWTVDAQGQPVAHRVGVIRTDGVTAAVTPDDLGPGDVVVIGLAARSEKPGRSQSLFGS